MRGDDDRHAAWLDEMLAELEPLADGVADVQTSMAMRRVIQQHGGEGPWTDEDLAAMTGRDVTSVRRVLHGWRQAGIAGPAPSENLKCYCCFGS